MKSKLLLGLLILSSGLTTQTKVSEPVIHQMDTKGFDAINIDKKTVFLVPHSRVMSFGLENKVELVRNANSFIVKEGESFHFVESYNTDPILRNLDLKKVIKFAAMGGKFKVTKSEDGEYAVIAQIGLLGGGIGGANAGFWLSKGLTYFVGYGAITAISFFTGPAAPATFKTLSLLAGPAIESVSNAAAIGGGLLGGMATGPV